MEVSSKNIVFNSSQIYFKLKLNKEDTNTHPQSSRTYPTDYYKYQLK